MQHSSGAKRVPLALLVALLSLLAMACSFPFQNPSTASTLAAPGNLQCTPSTLYIALSWSAVPGAESYRVYRSNGGSFSLVAENIAITTWKDTAVTAGVSYSYKVCAFRVAGGEGAFSAALSAQMANPTEAQELVKAGEGYLSQRPANYSLALTAFARALQSDPANYVALLWTCALTLAQTATNSSVQTLATTYLGIENYPTSMDEMFQPGPHGMPAWISDAVESGSIFVPVAPGTGNYLFTGGTYTEVGWGNGDLVLQTSISFFPQVRIPDTIRAWAGNPPVITPNEYMMAFFYNLATHNPAGFNGLVDHVVDRILSTALDKVAATLDVANVPADAKIDITPSMFGGMLDNGWPLDINSQPATISIGKAELLGLTGFLQMVKTGLLMAKTVNLTFPVLDYYNAVNPIDHPELTSPALILAALYSLDNPIKSGFLYARPDAGTTLTAAKTAFLTALGSVDQAATMILARTEATPFTLSAFSPIPDISANWTTASDILNYSHIVATKMSLSVQFGAVMVIPTDFQNYTTGPMEFIAHYAVPEAWPGVPDDGPYTDHPPLAVGVNLAPAFVTPLAALDSLLDLRVDGEPNWYPFTLTFTLTETTDPLHPQLTVNSAASDYAPIESIGDATVVADLSLGTSRGAIVTDASTPYHFYGIRLKDLTLGGTLAVSDDMLNNLKDVLPTLTSNAFSRTALDALLVRDTESGGITAYLPAFPAFVADNSFAPAGTPISVDANGDTYTDINYTTKGSFWWAVADMTQNGPYFVGTDFSPAIPQ